MKNIYLNVEDLNEKLDNVLSNHGHDVIEALTRASKAENNSDITDLVNHIIRHLTSDVLVPTLAEYSSLLAESTDNDSNHLLRFWKNTFCSCKEHGLEETL